MEIKIKDAEIEVDKAKKVAARNRLTLDRIARPATVARKEYESIMKYEMEKNWKAKRNKMSSKVEFIRCKRKRTDKPGLS